MLNDITVLGTYKHSVMIEQIRERGNWDDVVMWAMGKTLGKSRDACITLETSLDLPVFQCFHMQKEDLDYII